MYIHETYNIDFNLDQLKNQDTPVCFAFSLPRFTQSLSNVFKNNSRPSSKGVENSRGDNLLVIPVRNAGEGRQL